MVNNNESILKSFFQGGFVIILVVVIGFASLFYVGVRYLDGGESYDLPNGFSVEKTIGQSHFATVAASHISNIKIQRNAGRAICHEKEQTDYCEVYMFKNKADMPDSFPIRRGNNKAVGLYKMSNGKESMRALHGL